MSGLELCRRFREMDGEEYSYFILLTSKSEKEEVALGLDSGADDFLTKPVDNNELRARITAGERLIEMQRSMVQANRALSETLGELQQLYDNIDSDLQEAKKLQQSLVKERFRALPLGIYRSCCDHPGMLVVILLAFLKRARTMWVLCAGCVGPWHQLGTDDCSLGWISFKRCTGSKCGIA